MKKKNAISLIVLVITIIVMAILAATVIITLSNTNIISEANNAVKKTEAQQVEEMKALMVADGMLGKNPESQTIGDTTLTWLESEKRVTVVGTKNTEREGIIIPEGFGYVEGTRDTGLVIEDKEGNQFVWVPVEYTATGTIEENGLDTGFTSVFKRGKPVETSTGSGVYKMTGEVNDTRFTYTEPYASGYDTEAAEYNAMMSSVQKYGGFYIARFEAGDGEATEKRTKVTPAHKVVSKKGAYVYNKVPWGKALNDTSSQTLSGVENVAGAVELSKNMYKDSTSVVSTLCYGVQWDAALNFVSDETHSIKNSNLWGNCYYAENEAAAGRGKLQTCGYNEAWKAKNIYDLAGNVWEWTMETMDATNRVYRGSCYAYDGDGYYSASYRIAYDGGATVNSAGSFYGFRVTLYIK